MKKWMVLVTISLLSLPVVSQAYIDVEKDKYSYPVNVEQQSRNYPYVFHDPEEYKENQYKPDLSTHPNSGYNPDGGGAGSSSGGWDATQPLKKPYKGEGYW